jgi:peroxiredoxin
MHNKIALAFIAITTLFCTLGFTTSEPLPIGSPLPMADVTVKDVSGKTISLKSAAKKNGLLVMFSCNTCPYVIKNQARTKAICTYAQEHNIGVIVVNSNEAQRSEDDSYDAMKQYAQQQGYKWFYTVDTDSKIADAFGANRTPECFLFGSDLKLKYHGAIDDSPTDPSAVKRQHVKEAINEMVAGKNISVAESRSVGCSIKRKS